MKVNDFVLDAVNTVLGWEDLSDEACSDAVTYQACLMAGIDPDDMWGYDVDFTVH